MVIGIDATRANKPEKTGVEWYALFVIQEMIKQDPQTTFRLYFNSDPEDSLKNLGPNVEYRIMKWPFKYLWTQIRLGFEMLVNPPDVLFIPASIMPFLSPKKTVTTLHDVAYEVYKEDLSWKGRMYQKVAAWYAVLRCPKILTVSEFSKKEIIRFYNAKEDQIVVSLLGLSSRDKIPPPTNDKEPYFLFIGRLESKKNIAQLIRVFNEVHQTDWGKKYKLHLIGYPSRGWEEAKGLITEFNLADSVIVHGWLKEEEKYTILSKASLYIHLAKYEGFGFGLIEAMAAGTVAIANNAASLPEIGSDCAVYVDANNIPETVKTIRDTLENKELQTKLITKGFDRAKQFTWQETAKITLETLKQTNDK